MKIIRRVCTDDLVKMCINYNYYTKGDCVAYGNMLFKFKGTESITIKEIEWLANDIKDHSDTEDDVVNIAYRILTEACYEFIDDLDF